MSTTRSVRILSETHEHEGALVPKGTVIDLDIPTADHLVAIKAAEQAAPKSGAQRSAAPNDSEA